MGKSQKCHISVGLLAHVDTSSSIPGSKTGDFYALWRQNYCQAQKHHHMLCLCESKSHSIWWLVFKIQLCGRIQN